MLQEFAHVHRIAVGADHHQVKVFVEQQVA